MSERWRCDHCQKFINELHAPGTLEGIVSKGIDINFCICPKCFDRKGIEAEYWDKWVKQREVRA